MHLWLRDKRLIQWLLFAGFAETTDSENHNENHKDCQRQVSIVAVPLADVVLIVCIPIVLTVESVVMVLAPRATEIIIAGIAVETIAAVSAIRIGS